MSPLVVVDASVALKWVVTETGSRKRVAQGVLVADDAVTALDADVITADLRLADSARSQSLPVRPLLV